MTKGQAGLVAPDLDPDNAARHDPLPLVRTNLGLCNGWSPNPHPRFWVIWHCPLL